VQATIAPALDTAGEVRATLALAAERIIRSSLG